MRRGRPCFSGDLVARLEKISETERVIQFGSVLRAPKKYGRVFNAHSELTEKDIRWSASIALPFPAPPQNDVFLLNRPVRRGSIVKHRGRLAQVTHVDIRATALAAHLDGRSVIQGVLLDDLKEQSVLLGTGFKGVPVLLDHWLGLIENVALEISFRLPCGNTGYFLLTHQDSVNPVGIALGDQVLLTDEHLESTRWDSEGSLQPSDLDLSMPGTVFRIQPVAVTMSWDSHVEGNSLAPPPKPAEVIQGSQINRLQFLCNTPTRIQEYFPGQAKLVLTSEAGHSAHKIDTWAFKFVTNLIMDPLLAGSEIEATQPSLLQSFPAETKVLVQPLFLQSSLSLRWLDDGNGVKIIDSADVEEIIAGPEATFVGRLNTDYKDSSYGIAFHSTPQMIAEQPPDKLFTVLWFVDLKNDKLDPGVRVLRLQQEELTAKELVILHDMQRLLNPAAVLVQRDKEDDFLAGHPQGILPDGRLEIWGFDGKSYLRWPTMLIPRISNARASLAGTEYFAAAGDNNGNSVSLDWTEIYYDAMADFEDTMTMVQQGFVDTETTKAD